MVSTTMSTFTRKKDGFAVRTTAEIETESDGETEKEERLYDETLQYLMHEQSTNHISLINQA